MRQSRLVIVFSLELLFVIVILVQYANIMLKTPYKATTPPTSQWQERGAILDRNASIIAMQVERKTLLGWKPEIEDVEEVATILAPILDMKTDLLHEKILSGRGNIIIQRTLEPEASGEIEELKKTGLLKGIYLVPDKKRIYTENEFSSPLVGYTGIDNIGLDGVEYTFNNELVSKPDLPFGNNVYLTINSNTQRAMYGIAEDTYKTHKPEHMTLIVMDARTGEILAYVSYPTFDPNNFTEYTSEERRNRPITDVYEPGSVFKVFSVAALLDLGAVDMNDTFDTSQGYTSSTGNFTITDIGNYGVVDIEHIIKYSSNVGVAFAVESVDSNSFYNKLIDFGFGRKSNIELNGEQLGILHPPARWSVRSKHTIAIGQEIAITAMQIVTAATVFANDGMILRPTIIRKIVSPLGETIYKSERTVLHQVISPETSREMLRIMNASTDEGGTARRLRIDSINISAKTGTAEVYDVKQKAYSKEDFIASTLAVVPTENPEFIIYAAIHKPSAGEIYGGRIAAPVVRQAIEFLIAERELRHPDSKTVVQENKIIVTTPSLPPLEDRIPNYQGLAKRVLLPLLLQEEIPVEIIGDGWVFRQTPAPGTPLSEVNNIVLELR